MTGKGHDTPDLMTLLARMDDFRQAERRAASARMVSVAGHLVGTPLNVIAGRAALIRTNPTPEAIEENVRRIEEQVERLALRIRRLIDYFGFAEPGAPDKTLGDVVEEARGLYAPVAASKNVSLEVSTQGHDSLKVDGALAPLVLTTLLSLALRTASAGQKVALTVSERGPQMVALDLVCPGLEAPPKSFERLEPPDHGLRYDAGTLETLWVCLGLSRRLGGGLEVTKAASGAGVTVRFDCAHR
ncbi:MAG: integral rane sensor signal transduction histidine kinase [Polyangiaceae bacterium]|jgi:signal transduction histidine kinase|nr:integral rane sensor signal transduction histidine kinase [Polyangiaceae bacterium]